PQGQIRNLLLLARSRSRQRREQSHNLLLSHGPERPELSSRAADCRPAGTPGLPQRSILKPPKVPSLYPPRCCIERQHYYLSYPFLIFRCILPPSVFLSTTS